MRNDDLTPALKRFWAKVHVGGPDDCWPWLGKLGNAGHGHTRFSPWGDQTYYAHRISYWLANGRKDLEFPVIRHLCHNAACCNPRHLEPGTQKDNAADSVKAGRYRSKLSKEQVLAIREADSRGVPTRVIADLCGVKNETIRAVLSGRTWVHV